MRAQQMLMPGIPAPTQESTWQRVYTRIRDDGTKVWISIPPDRDVVIIGTDARRVAIRRDELARVIGALDNAREDMGL